jgi:GT2 family glycosyltransferase
MAGLEDRDSKQRLLLLEMKVDILIVNYNGRKFLAECIDSLRSQVLRPERVVVVENASTDESLEFLKARYPEVVVLAQERNLGFAEGNNRGIDWIFANGNPDAVALLNNDTKVDSNWLASLARALDSDAGLGAVASRMVYASDPDRINNAGDMPLWDGTGVARGRHQPAACFGEDAEVFGACAGAALYRARALKEAAMEGAVFDPDYFAYNEDVDLSWRLQKRGWRCRFAADAIVHHHHSGTIGRFSTWILFQGERNRCWTLLKNFSWWAIVASPVYTVARYLTMLSGSGENGHGTAANYRAKFSILAIAGVLIRAWLAAVAGAPRMLVKRWRHGLGWSFGDQQKIMRELGAELTSLK